MLFVQGFFEERVVCHRGKSAHRKVVRQYALYYNGAMVLHTWVSDFIIKVSVAYQAFFYGMRQG
jgi:hypothetical protein